MAEQTKSPTQSDRMVYLGGMFLVVLLLTAFLALLCCPPDSRPIFNKELTNYKIHLGLDLAGGTELLYRIDPKDSTSNQSLDYLMEETLNVLRQRIDKSPTVTVKDPRIQRQAEDIINIQLPGITQDEVTTIKQEIQTLGNLEFRLVASPKVYKAGAINNKQHVESQERETYNKRKATTESSASAQRAFKKYQEELKNDGYKWYPSRRSDDNTTGDDRLVWINDAYDFTGRKFSTFYLSQGSDLSQVIAFELKSDSKKAFERFTEAHVGEQLAIIFNGVVVAAPVIKSKLPGSGVLQGFQPKELDALLQILHSGSLEVIPELANENSIGPSLGQDSIRLGLIASIIGLIAIILFMAFYYMGTGLIADFALVLNIIIVGGIMVITGETLTLPGIAGLVLMMGMAVDANILIFERIREEKRKLRELFKKERGSDLEVYTRENLLDILQNAFSQAFRTIFDSNITTLITAIILYIFGAGPVKGFAFTMGIGILANFFTAIFVTRILMELAIEFHLFSKMSMLEWIKPTRISFHKAMCGIAIVATLVIVVGMSLFTYRGASNYGLDLKGGIIAQISLKKPLPTDEVRARLSQTFKQIEVQNAGYRSLDNAWYNFSIRMPNRNDQELEEIRQKITQLNDEYSKVNAKLVKAINNEVQKQNQIDEFKLDLRKLQNTKNQEEIASKKLAIQNLERDKAIYTNQRDTYQPELDKIVAQRNELVTKRTSLVGVEELKQSVYEKFANELSPEAFGTIKTNKQFRIYHILPINFATPLSAEFIEQTLENFTHQPEEIDDPNDTKQTPDGKKAQKRIHYGFFKDVYIATPEFGIWLKKPADIQDNLADYFREKLIANSGIDGDLIFNATIKIEASKEPNFDTVIMLKFNESVPQLAIQSTISACGWTDYAIHHLEQGQRELSCAEIYFEIPLDHKDKATQEIQLMANTEAKNAFENIKYNEKTIFLSTPFPQFSQIAGMVAREQKAKAYQAIILSLIAILIYIAIRFPNGWIFGMGSVIALFHDVAMTVSIIIFFAMAGILRIEIDLTVIAALLTIVGYSINNTIVIFDRIREFQHRHDPEEWARMSYADIREQFNAAIGQTLARTILTTVTTLISIISIFVLNVGQGNSMEGFSFAMICGLCVGLYSSIYLATGFVLWREKRRRA